MNDASSGKDDETKKFHEMGLDDRILKAIAKLGWITPTLIQEKAVPLILEGKDVLVKARTGSGKTGAFALPIIQKILSSDQGGSGPLALILAPSKELSRQIYNHFQQLIVKCSQEIRVVDISPQVDIESQRGVLRNPPEIVVSTPARALLHLRGNTFSLTSLQVLVIDEADLIFSFGHKDDINALIKELPRVYQAVLSSATLTDEVSTLKGLLLQNCVSLKLQEPPLAPLAQLVHLNHFAEERGKAFFLYSVFKLSLVQGRSIVFVNSVNKCYRLKLFLAQFEIPSCILNSELPAASRIHALSQFNDGKYNIIITSDESGVASPDPPKGKKKLKPSGDFPKDKESGVSRGIDFRDVSNVINYDFPLSVTSYIHRVGRTARGQNKGTAISLVSAKEKPMLEEVNRFLSEGLSLREPTIFKEFHFNENEIEGLKYRVNNAWSIITSIMIKEVRLSEIKQELFNSKKLKHYFKDNPKDLELLRHDKIPGRRRKLPDHVANVPDYLVPPSLRGVTTISMKKKTKPPIKAAGLVNNKHKAKMANPLSNYDILEQDEPNEAEDEGPRRKRRYFHKGRHRN